MSAEFLNDGHAPSLPIPPEAVTVTNCDAEEMANDLRDDLRRLLADDPRFARAGPQQGPSGPYVQDMAHNLFPGDESFAIVSDADGKLWQVYFTMGDDGEPILSDGPPVEVEQDTGYEPVARAPEVGTEEWAMGMDAQRQLEQLGRNPPSWVDDEGAWERAKTAASKTYDKGDKAYWPVVATIYKNMT
jgi:hypothetical protein